jgi:hypothetical protein
MGTGDRHIRIFPTSTDINITSHFLLDTTISFHENTYYTLIHTGYARPGQTPAAHLLVLQDTTLPQPGANQIAVRVINAAFTIGAMDAFADTSTSTPLPATPTIANIPYGTASPYVMLPAGPLSLRATAAGTRAPQLASATAPAGTPGSTYLDPGAGSTIAGTVLTAIIIPGAVAGSTAGGSTSPSITWVVDRRPPRTTS